MKYRLQSMYNHMGWAASVVSPFYFILLGIYCLQLYDVCVTSFPSSMHDRQIRQIREKMFNWTNRILESAEDDSRGGAMGTEPLPLNIWQPSYEGGGLKIMQGRNLKNYRFYCSGICSGILLGRIIHAQIGRRPLTLTLTL